jgi:hypothetical protein
MAKMNHVSGILKELLTTANLRQGMADYACFAQWSEIVGAHLAGSTRPMRVQGQTLWVFVENSTLIHHISFLIPRMLERIRETSPGTRITSIRFTLNPEQ